MRNGQDDEGEWYVIRKTRCGTFFQLWFPLLNFVNQKYRICPQLESIDRSRDIDASDARAIANYLWSHPEAIDEYLSKTELPEEYARTIAGWKRCKPGKYIVERHLKSGSVFISEKDQKVYMVKGLFSTWEEMLGKGPVLLDAVLLSFRDSIISDGLVASYPVRFGSGIREAFKEIYRNAKADNTIVFSLNGSESEYHPRKKKETGSVESYVISISFGTGCYRHIQIGANATLYDLHKAILKAFEFDDDHQHAFFMDNYVWSPMDAYVSSKTDFGNRLTKKCTLKKLKLEKNRKFKYLFDYGEEWVFQCKVLRKLEEKTDIPGVIKAVGEAPEQYPEYEDEEDEPFPEEMNEEEIQKLLSELPLSKKEIDGIYAYMTAATNLYGLISLDELYWLYNSQNPPVDMEAFLAAASVLNYEDGNDFLIVEKTESIKPTLEENIKDLEIISIKLFLGGLEENIRALRRMQKGKPLKIFPKAEFLRFEDFSYFPETPQRSAMIRYLHSMASSLPGSAEAYCNDIQAEIVADAPLQVVLNTAKADGLTADPRWDFELFCKLFQDLNNATFKHANRGHTPEEMLAMLHPGRKQALQNASARQMSLFCAYEKFNGGLADESAAATPGRNRSPRLLSRLP